MHRILPMCMDAAIAALALMPVFWYLYKRRLHNIWKVLGYWLFAVYLCAMFSMVGLPDIRYIRFQPHFNLKPFAYMFSDHTISLLNVAMFLPLGFFLPIFWVRFSSIYKTILFGFNISLLIEILQIFTVRATDVNDLITNTFGTFLGWCLGILTLHSFPQIQPQEKNGGLRIVCGTTLSLMVFIHPFLEGFVEYILLLQL